MIRKLSCLSVVVAALLMSAPAAQAANPRPAPSNGAPGTPLLDGVFGSLEVGSPAGSLNTLLPTGLLGP